MSAPGVVVAPQGNDRERTPSIPGLGHRTNCGQSLGRGLQRPIQLLPVADLSIAGAPHVFFLGDRFHVVRSDASRVAAQVIEHQPGRNGAVDALVVHPVRQLATPLAWGTDAGIAAGVASQPPPASRLVPAIAFLVRLVPALTTMMAALPGPPAQLAAATGAQIDRLCHVGTSSKVWTKPPAVASVRGHVCSPYHTRELLHLRRTLQAVCAHLGVDVPADADPDRITPLSGLGVRPHARGA